MTRPKKNYNINIHKTLIIHALYGSKFKSADELANELGILKRTVNSRLKEIIDSKKFKIAKRGVMYRIMPDSQHDFTLNDADIEILYDQYFFDSIEEKLSEKLIYLIGGYLDSKKQFLASQSKGQGFREYFKDISIIKKAIREKKKINILKYKDRRDEVHEGFKAWENYMEVIPVKLDENLNKVYCICGGIGRCFNLERMSAVTSSYDKIGVIPKWDPDREIDVFGFLPKQVFGRKKFKIVMRLTNFAYSLLIRQFPAIDNSSNIIKAPKRSKKPYVLIVETNDPYALARFFAGIASEVEISNYKGEITDESAKELIRKWFDEYVREGLLGHQFL